MSSQFLNGHPTGGPTSDMSSHYANPHLGQMIPEGGSHVPQGSNVQDQYSAGPTIGKPLGGPSASFNQSNSAWDPSLSRDSNGLPRGPYNPNQLSSEFDSMQISGRPGPPWSQAQNLIPSFTGQPGGQAQGHPPMAPSLTEASNSGIPAAQPPSFNAYPPQQPGSHAYPHQPPSSGAFQPPRSTYYSSQPHPNAFMQPQPPTSQVFGSHPPSNFAPPQGFPPSEPPQMMRGAMRPPLSGPVSSGTLPTHMNSGPQQFPPGPMASSQGPPSGQWAPQTLAPQQNVPTGYQDNSQHGVFRAQTAQPAPSQPYPAQPLPALGPAGFPAPGYKGQRQRFPGALPDGSYSGAPGFQHGPPYLARGNFAPQPPPMKRLNADEMPSQIQVIENDKKNRGGKYSTGQRGSVPPLVTSDFFVVDQGTCSPRFFRATSYNIPCSGDLLRQTHIPVAVVITPFARLNPSEVPPPIVDLGQMGPVRCNRCKVYMSPGMVFIDGGRKFQCCFCNGLTEVPPEYFHHLDHTGRRFDWLERPELHLGAYEFIAPVEYCQGEKLPQPPAFIFMIDVSYPSIKSGLVNLLCTRLKHEILSNLPKDIGEDKSEVRVGFVTYAKELHFYNINGNLSQPQMLVVSDINDVFIPLVDGFLVKPSEAEAIIDSLMVQISQMFAENQEREAVLGPVIQAGLDALKSSERVGKLFIFHCSMPSLEAPGKLKPREDRNLLGTDKEKNLLTPQNKFYTKLGRDCLAAGCSVDIFLFPTSYVDVATIAEVPRITGGSLYKYNNFQADIDGDMLIDDLRTNIERQVAFNVTLKLRTSTGIRPVDFLGNFHMENTTEVELASLDMDKCVTIEIKHDDKLNEADGAIAQAVILYTSIGGKRRLRILNTTLDCCTQVSEVFRCCELDTLINYLAKLSIRESLNSSTKQVREQLINRCVQSLACYRKNCASPTSSGQLILPECMKLMPLYINSMIKSSLFQSENINLDDRSYFINLVNSMNISDTVAFFYPRLLPLHELDPNSSALPVSLRCSQERLKENGAYLLENGLVMFLWVGLSISPEWVQQVFGVPSVAQVDIDKTKLQDFDNLLSVRVRGIIKTVRNERHRHMKLTILRQRDRLEPVMQSYMVEDKSPMTSSNLSYVDFLCHVHNEIRNLLV